MWRHGDRQLSPKHNPGLGSLRQRPIWRVVTARGPMLPILVAATRTRTAMLDAPARERRDVSSNDEPYTSISICRIRRGCFSNFASPGGRGFSCGASSGWPATSGTGPYTFDAFTRMRERQIASDAPTAGDRRRTRSTGGREGQNSRARRASAAIGPRHSVRHDSPTCGRQSPSRSEDAERYARACRNERRAPRSSCSPSRSNETRPAWCRRACETSS